jgi:hypothetical protein
LFIDFHLLHEHLGSGTDIAAKVTELKYICSKITSKVISEELRKEGIQIID